MTFGTLARLRAGSLSAQLHPEKPSARLPGVQQALFADLVRF